MFLTSLCIWMWLIAGGIIAPGTPVPGTEIQVPTVHLAPGTSDVKVPLRPRP